VVTSLYPGPTVVLALVFFRERMGAARIAGLVLALVGVALISA
jgi:drug/metabolite transporter (DMT)-like permease